MKHSCDYRCSYHVNEFDMDGNPGATYILDRSGSCGHCGLGGTLYAENLRLWRVPCHCELTNLGIARLSRQRLETGNYGYNILGMNPELLSEPVLVCPNCGGGGDYLRGAFEEHVMADDTHIVEGDAILCHRCGVVIAHRSFYQELPDPGWDEWDDNDYYETPSFEEWCEKNEYGDPDQAFAVYSIETYEPPEDWGEPPLRNAESPDCPAPPDARIELPDPVWPKNWLKAKTEYLRRREEASAPPPPDPPPPVTDEEVPF